jgi:hypothetical protein
MEKTLSRLPQPLQGASRGGEAKTGLEQTPFPFGKGWGWVLL